ncbi:MAG: ribosome maturation factor RimM [Cyanobacteria bacterium]|nr:ribosome maturation factor RimM [Cyanobacteriota bacterium]
MAQQATNQTPDQAKIQTRAQASPLASGPAGDDPGELLEVGRLVSAQGLQGELRLNPLSDFPERFTVPGRRWLQGRTGPAKAVTLLSGRQLPGRELYVLRLEGINDRASAEALVGQALLVPASDRPPLAEGEFHLLDLVGLEVRLLADGSVIGRVSDLLHAGNDLLEVELTAPAAADTPPEAAPPAEADQPAEAGTPAETAKPAGPAKPTGQAKPRRILIPFVEPIVPQIHLAEGWLGITPPPGLLEI